MSGRNLAGAICRITTWLVHSGALWRAKSNLCAPVPGNGLSISTFVNVAPVDEQTTVNRFAVVRSLQTSFAKKFANCALNLEIWDKIVYDAMMA